MRMYEARPTEILLATVRMSSASDGIHPTHTHASLVSSVPQEASRPPDSSVGPSAPEPSSQVPPFVEYIRKLSYHLHV